MDAAPSEPFQRAFISEGELSHAFLIFPQDRHDLFGLGRLGKGAESAQVAERTVTSRRWLAKSGRAHPRSQKSPQTVDPLDCRDLFMTRTVLTPELVGLVLQPPLARGCFLLQTFCPPAGIRIEALGALASALTTNADP